MLKLVVVWLAVLLTKVCLCFLCCARMQNSMRTERERDQVVLEEEEEAPRLTYYVGLV